MRDAIVIGAGIIGATVAKAMRSKGVDVLLLDDRRPMSGSAPSGGHLKPGWFGKMPKSEYEPAMELINETWGLIEQDFTIYPKMESMKVSRVNMDIVMAYDQLTLASVESIEHIRNVPLVKYRTRTEPGRTIEERTKLLIVAAGIHSSTLLPGISITGKQGCSFRVSGSIKKPFIKPWAPYKQIVAHQQTPTHIWIGDGAAILSKNWTVDTTAKSAARCMDALSRNKTDVASSIIRQGIRPYADHPETEPCLFKQLGPKVWVATGSGKMGTISAGWVTRRIICAIV